jgi:PHS family inorganic phosphate transporter-like MFS transporter
MMAAVFLMQPFGQILAAGVGWGVLENIVKKRHLDNLPAHGADLRDDQKKAILSAIDSIWRWVIGAGCIPAALAIFWRFAIPESPRYTMDVDDNATQAYYDVRRYGKKKDNEETTKRVRRGQRPDGGRKSNTSDASGNSHSTPAGGITEGTRRRRLSIGPRHPPIDISGGQSSSAYVGKSRGPLTDTTTDMSGGESSSTPANNTIGGHATEVGKPVATELNDITFCDHFCRDGNWKYLFATSSCWFFLDFAFYALGINNPRQISAIWDDYLPLPEKNDTSYAWPTTLLIGINNPTFSNATAADWQNPFDPGTNIYQELYHSAKQYILTISCGSLMGSILLLSIITKIPRKKWLVGSFVILALLFAILGGFYSAVAFKPHSHWATVLFYIACQFFFNLGTLHVAPRRQD